MKKILSVPLLCFVAVCSSFAADVAAGAAITDSADSVADVSDVSDDDDGYFDVGEDLFGVTFVGAPETTGQTAVIDRETIERSTARDLATLLEEELNMSVVRYGGYGNRASLKLRGFDTSRIAILVDGVPANSQRTGGFDANQIDLNNVERVEVTYGGSDTRYNVSGSLGGVVNIVTIKNQEPGLSVGIVFSNTGYMPGRYNTRHSGGETGGPDFGDVFDMQSLSVFAAKGAGGFSWRASGFANVAGNHYLYEDDFGFARRKISNEVVDGGGNLKLVFAMPEDASLLFDAKAYYARKKFPITMNSVGNALATDLVLAGNVSLAAPVAFRDDLATEASLGYRAGFGNYGVLSSTGDRHVTAINRWSWYLSDRLTVLTGADWSFLHVGTDSPVELRPVKIGNRGGIYLTGEYRVLENLLVTGSLKGVTDTASTVAVPKAGLSWRVGDSVTLKNNYFRSFKFPDFDDLYYRSPDNTAVGNPNLRPEDGWGTDVVGEFSFGGNVSLVASVFAQQTSDSIHWTKSSGGRWSPENIGRAYFAGADLRPTFAVKAKPGRGNFPSIKIGPSYQFLYTRLLPDGNHPEASRRIPYSPVHVIGGTVDVGWKTGSLLLSGQRESPSYADAGNSLYVDSSFVANATVNQNAGKHAVLFASLRNIFNARYESFSAYPMPGVTMTVGVRVNVRVGSGGGE